MTAKGCGSVLANQYASLGGQRCVLRKLRRTPNGIPRLHLDSEYLTARRLYQVVYAPQAQRCPHRHLAAENGVTFRNKLSGGESLCSKPCGSIRREDFRSSRSP